MFLVLSIILEKKNTKGDKLCLGKGSCKIKVRMYLYVDHFMNYDNDVFQ